MTITSDGPADTTMMRIVHEALRRDLERARTTLESTATGVARRRAVADHLGWMMRFLHAHHTSEDIGLYALVRARADGDARTLAVLDRMATDHGAIEPAMAAVETEATALATDPTEAANRRTIDALTELEAVLLPHLRDEEDVAMPIASGLVTAAEWQALEQEHNLDPKSMSELGFEGHWLIDGADGADRATVLGLVPPIPRLVLEHGFARRYRRHAAACWGEAERPPRRVQMANDVAVTVDAGIDEVWDVVRDVTRVGEWSHECTGAAWLGGATAAAPGARFRGRNHAGFARWGRECEILAADPYELVWRTVPTALYPDSSEWRIELAPVGAGTRIAQRFRVLRAPPRVLSTLYASLIPSHRDRTRGLTEDLRRLGEVAGRSRTAAS